MGATPFGSIPQLPQQQSPIQYQPGPRGGIQGPPPGLSPDPAVANKAANITQGLAKFLESYVNSRKQAQEMYGQKVDKTMDDLASGRTTLAGLDQNKVARWMKLSGRPYNTQEYTPEAEAWNQQAHQTDQVAKAVQAQLQQQGNQQMGPPIGQGAPTPMQNAAMPQGGPQGPQVNAPGGIPPGALQALMAQRLSQASQAPTPNQTGQPQLQPMVGPPAQMTQPPQGGIKGFLQHLVNPAAGASMNSPAMDQIRALGVAGARGPQSPYGVNEEHIAHQLALSQFGQQALLDIAHSQGLREVLNQHWQALVDGPDNPGYLAASRALSRVNLTSQDPLDMFMRVTKEHLDSKNIPYTGEELYTAGARMMYTAQILGPMRDQLYKAMGEDLHDGHFKDASTAIAAYTEGDPKAWEQRTPTPVELKQMVDTQDTILKQIDPNARKAPETAMMIAQAMASPNPTVRQMGMLLLGDFKTSAARNDLWKRMEMTQAGENVASRSQEVRNMFQHNMGQLINDQLEAAWKEHDKWDPKKNPAEAYESGQTVQYVQEIGRNMFRSMGFGEQMNPIAPLKSGGITGGYMPEGRGTYNVMKPGGATPPPMPSKGDASFIGTHGGFWESLKSMIDRPIGSSGENKEAN